MPPPPAFDRRSLVCDPLMDKENSVPRVLAAAHASKLSGAARVGGTSRAARPALGRDTAPALLRLGRPEHVPCLRFDDARVGVSQTLPLRVQNDTPHVQEARFERVPRDVGFLVDPDRVFLPPGASQVVRVAWCPSKASRHAHTGDMRVTLDDGEGDAGRLRRGKKMSLAVRVRGSAVAPAEASRVSETRARPGALSYTFHARRNRTREARDRDDAREHAHNVSGSFGRDARTTTNGDGAKASARGPNPVAPVGKTLRLRRASGEAREAKKPKEPARPSFASFRAGASVARERERAFGEWVNSVIAPPEDVPEAEAEKPGASGASAARARARRAAERAARERLWVLYSSDAEVRDVILRVEAQIDLGNLRLRGVRDGFESDTSGINAKGGGSFMEDTRLREAFREALGSYGVFWLRAAVDVVAGVPEPERGEGEETRARSRSRLVAALMRDEEVELAYGSEGRGVAPFAEGYAEALAGTVLKRTLLLVFLLDRAQAGAATAAPLLFRKDARLKSSADVIRAALQASCHGEGDVLRRLGHYGYKLHHAQEPVREYDFRTENLAMELRDGVRLCRLVDALGDARGEASALARAAFSAEARVTKRRNVALALETAIEKFGVVGLRRVRPDDVVDGDLAATMTALYQLRVHFQGPAALGDWDEARRETEAWRERRRAQIAAGVFRRSFFKDTLASAVEQKNAVELTEARAESALDEDAVAEAMFAEELADARLESTTTDGWSAKTATNGETREDGDRLETDAFSGGSVVQRCELALLRWARAVTATRGVAVCDFSRSFADGAALCALIHAYAPELVHLREIKRRVAADLQTDATAMDDGANMDDRDRVGLRTGVEDPRTHAFREKKRIESNFALAERAVAALRGPASTKDALPRRVPFGARDAARDARGPNAEIVAGFLLELRRALLRRAAEHAAARVVQNAWLRRRRARFEVPEHLPLRWAMERRARAALAIQKALRGAFGRRDAAARARAILVAQTLRRGGVARRALRVAVRAATCIAACARGTFAREEALDRRFATLIAQTRARGALARRAFLKTRAAAVTAQRWRRASATRAAFEARRREHRAATKIGAAFKAFCARYDYRALRMAVVFLQRAFRARQRAIRASVTIQRHARGFIARERYLRVWVAAMTCQASRRGALQRRAFLELRDAAVVAQRAARDAAGTRRRHAATVEIQRHARGFIARERYLRVWVAAMTCQASRRGALQRRAFLELRNAASVCALIRREAVAGREAREARALRLRVLAAADEASARRAAEAAAAETEAREAAAAELAAARRADDACRAVSAAEAEREARASRLAERAVALERAAALKAETKRRVDAKTPGRRRDETETETDDARNARPRASSSLCTPARLSLQARAVKARRLEFEILHESAETRAATAIQAAWRGWTRRVEFALLRWAAVTAQALARGAAARRRLAEARKRKGATRREGAREKISRKAREETRNVSRRRAPDPARGGGSVVSRSASLLAWSAASSVAASSDSEAEDDEARGVPARGDTGGLGLTPVSNASQDLSCFDSVRSEPTTPTSERDETEIDAGFADAAAAADALAGARSVGDVRRALSALAAATRASAGGRAAASSPRALHALLRVMRRCDRSGAHEPVLRLAHDVLETLSGDESGPARAVFEAKDAVTVITEHMQMCRDRFELVGAAARTLANLCGDARRAEAVARAERGRVTRRVQGICEILGNTLAARRHRRRGALESSSASVASDFESPEGGVSAASAETRRSRALETTVLCMRELVARLERCEGEVRFTRRTRTSLQPGGQKNEAKGEETFVTRAARRPGTRFASEAAGGSPRAVSPRRSETDRATYDVARVRSRPRVRSRESTESTHARTWEKRASFSVSAGDSVARRPLAPRGGECRAEANAAKLAETKGGDENGERSRSRARARSSARAIDPDRDPSFGIGSFSRREAPFRLRDRFASSPIMSPRYVR